VPLEAAIDDLSDGISLALIFKKIYLYLLSIFFADVKIDF
jgi:hypothetical protein